MKSPKSYLFMTAVAVMVFSFTAMQGWASTGAPKDIQSRMNGKKAQAVAENSPALPYGVQVVKTRFAVSFGFYGPGPYYYSPAPYYYYDEPYYYYYGPRHRVYHRRYYYRHHHHW